MKTASTRTNRGLAIPLVVITLVVASILASALLRRTVHGSRLVDRTYGKKVAYHVAEAGLNKAVEELMRTPFFSRFILRDYVEAMRLQLGRPEGRVGQLPESLAERRYGPLDRNGARQTGGLGWAQLEGRTTDGVYQVTLVEHVSQAAMTRAGLPGKGAADPVKATLDHVAVYAKGVFDDPGLGETLCLVTAKILFRPEPFVFEYDTNGDGISAPRKLDKQTDPSVRAIPAPGDVDAKLSDLAFHPFLSPGRYAVWGSGNFQSPPPTNVSVIKSRVFFQTLASGERVRPIASLDFTGNALTLPSDPPAPDFLARSPTLNQDREFVQQALKDDNRAFVLNFGANKLVRDTFSRRDLPRDLTRPGSLDIAQADVERLVDTAAGGKLRNLDPRAELGRIIQAWVDQYAERLPTRSGRTAYGKEPGQARLALLEDTSLGKRDAFSTNLGKVFAIPQAELDKLNRLIDAFAAGQVNDGAQLLALRAAGPSSGPVAYVEDLTTAREFYAPVSFPRGKPEKYFDEVPDGQAIVDLNGNKKVDPEEIDAYLQSHPELGGKPPMVRQERYRIGNEFLDALKSGVIADPAAFYAEMEQAVQEINSPPVNQVFSATLSARPPNFAQMEHTIVLKAQDDPRLDIRLKDALREALKWVEVPGAANGETGEVAPVAVAIGLSYSMRWQCFCKDQAETTDDPSRETRRAASAAGVAR